MAMHTAQIGEYFISIGFSDFHIRLKDDPSSSNNADAIDNVFIQFEIWECHNASIPRFGDLFRKRLPMPFIELIGSGQACRTRSNYGTFACSVFRRICFIIPSLKVFGNGCFVFANGYRAHAD
jgi:hypothetical protein